MLYHNISHYSIAAGRSAPARAGAAPLDATRPRSKVTGVGAKYYTPEITKMYVDQLENATERPLDNSSENPLGKRHSFGNYRWKVKLCWKIPLNIHWKMPLNIHWKMPLEIHDDFWGVDFWCANWLPRRSHRPGMILAQFSSSFITISGSFILINSSCIIIGSSFIIISSSFLIPAAGRDPPYKTCSIR